MYTRTQLALPDYADKAFYAVYGEGADDEQCEGFASHWGGLDLDAFERAFSSGTGDDCLVGIFALGATGTEQVRERLFGLLTSASPLPRRETLACLLCLGEMHDQRVFPLMETFLQQSFLLNDYRTAFPEGDEDQRYELSWSAAKTMILIDFLEQWHSPTVIQTLRDAFQRVLAIQRAFPVWYDHPPVEVYDALAYVLGTHRAFHALDDLALPDVHRRTALMHMALGYLHYTATPGTSLVGEMIGNKPLQQKVANVLAEHTDLTEEERQACVSNVYNNATRRSRVFLPEEEETTDEEEEEEDEEEEAEDTTIVDVNPSLLFLYEEHTAPVRSLCWSPDGQSVVSGSKDGMVRVWHATTGQTKIVLQEQHSINAVAWSPQGDRIATGGNGHSIFIYDTANREKVVTCSGHTAWVMDVAWSPDGTRLASASLDRTVRVWDAHTGQALQTFAGHQAVAYSIAWSPDGTRLVSGSGYPEGLIFVWNVATGQRELVYEGHAHDKKKERYIPPDADEWDEAWGRGVSSVHHLAWSPTGNYLASAGLRDICRIWDATTGENMMAVPETSGPIDWSPDGGRFFNRHLFHYAINAVPLTPGSLWTQYHLKVPYVWHGLATFQVSPDGTMLAADSGPKVGIWDLS